MSSLTQDIIQSIQNAVGYEPVSLHEPVFNGNESKYIQD